jgi:hypothetical protein
LPAANAVESNIPGRREQRKRACSIVHLPPDPAGRRAFTMKSGDSVKFGHILDSLIT